MKGMKLPAGAWQAIFGELHRKQMNHPGRMAPVNFRINGDTYQVVEGRELGTIHVMVTPGDSTLQQARNELRRLQLEHSELQGKANVRVNDRAKDAATITKLKVAAKARQSHIQVRIKELEDVIASQREPRKHVIDVKEALETKLWAIEGSAADDVAFLESIKASISSGIEDSAGRLEEIQSETMGLAVTIDDIARSAHEANRAYCLSLGDESQLPWDEAADWQRESAVAGVQYLLDNPDAPAGALHTAWMDHKAADGWVYGETKDAEAKTHPCMVPFDQLPAAQQAKDNLFSAVVASLLPKLRATAEFIGKVKEATPDVTLVAGEVGGEVAHVPASKGRNAKKEEAKK